MIPSKISGDLTRLMLVSCRRCGPSSVCLAQHEMCTANCFQDEQCEMFPMRICGSIIWIRMMAYYYCLFTAIHVKLHKGAASTFWEYHWNRVSMVSWIPFDFSRLVMVVFFALLPVRNFHDCIVGGGCKTGTSVFWGDSKVWKCRHKALFGAEGVGWVAGSP